MPVGKVCQVGSYRDRVRSAVPPSTIPHRIAWAKPTKAGLPNARSRVVVGSNRSATIRKMNLIASGRFCHRWMRSVIVAGCVEVVGMGTSGLTPPRLAGDNSGKRSAI